MARTKQTSRLSTHTTVGGKRWTDTSLNPPRHIESTEYRAETMKQIVENTPPELKTVFVNILPEYLYFPIGGWREKKKRKVFDSHKGKVLIDVTDDSDGEMYDTWKLECLKRVKICDDEKCNRC